MRMGRCWKKKGKAVFLKNNITRYIETISGHMIAFVTSVANTITKKNTLKSTRLDFI
jgi:hypothetical protein